MSASVKSLLSTLTSRGPHRVLRGNLAIAGQPGVVFTPESGLNLPAVAFGHGWLTGVAHYRTLLEHLASWGIVAAAPDTERGPIPSHLGLATDLLTTLDICTGVRLGDGSISVHPERLALVGHGMGAGAAVGGGGPPAGGPPPPRGAPPPPPPPAPLGGALPPRTPIPVLFTQPGFAGWVRFVLGCGIVRGGGVVRAAPLVVLGRVSGKPSVWFALESSLFVVWGYHWPS